MTDILEVTTNAELDEILQKNEKVVLDAWASWCGPCKRLAPHYEMAAGKVNGAVFVKVNIEEAPEIQERFQIMSVPTVLGFVRNGDPIPVTSRTVIPLVEEVNAL